MHHVSIRIILLPFVALAILLFASPVYAFQPIWPTVHVDCQDDSFSLEAFERDTLVTEINARMIETCASGIDGHEEELRLLLDKYNAIPIYNGDMQIRLGKEAYTNDELSVFSCVHPEDTIVGNWSVRIPHPRSFCAEGGALFRGYFFSSLRFITISILHGNLVSLAIALLLGRVIFKRSKLEHSPYDNLKVDLLHSLILLIAFTPIAFVLFLRGSTEINHGWFIGFLIIVYKGWPPAIWFFVKR